MTVEIRDFNRAGQFRRIKPNVRTCTSIAVKDTQGQLSNQKRHAFCHLTTPPNFALRAVDLATSRSEITIIVNRAAAYSRIAAILLEARNPSNLASIPTPAI